MISIVLSVKKIEVAPVTIAFSSTWRLKRILVKSPLGARRRECPFGVVA